MAVAMSSVPRAAGVAWLALDEVPSTNAEAMRRAVAGETGPLYIRAERQTAGRGRSGRSWMTPAGNLALSRLGLLNCAPEAVPQLSLVTGLAVHRACRDLLDGAAAADVLRLKWPNDLMLGDAKLAGVLVEATVVRGQRVAVIGIGINVATAPEVVGRRTTALVDATGRTIDAGDVAERVAAHLEAVLAQWDNGNGFAAIREDWLRVATPFGTAICIKTGQGEIGGAFAGLDSDGALLLQREGRELQRFAYGDVTLASEEEMS